MRKTFNFNSLKRPWLRYVLATVLLAVLIGVVPVAKIWNVLTTANPIPLCVAAVAILTARLLGAMRTKVLTDHQGLSFSLRSIFEISCASTLYSMFLPGSFSGGIIRWYRFSQPHYGRSEAFAVLTAERVIDYLVLALFGLLCLTVETAAAQVPVVFWGLAGVAGVCLFVSLTILLGFGAPVSRWLQRHTNQSRWLPQAVLKVIRRVVNAILQYHNLGARKVLLLLSHSLLFHIVATAAVYLMAVSLELNLSFTSVGWLRAFTVLLAAVPLTPSGLGVREFSLIYLLLPFDVSAPQAVAFSFIQYAGMVFVALLGAFMDARRYLRVRPKQSKRTLQ